MGFLVGDVAAGLSSLKAAKDIIQSLNSIKSDAALNTVKIELQGHILDAQQGLLSAQEAKAADARTIADLKDQITGFENWETEKKRYQLKAIDTGAFAYMHKPGMEDGEPAVWLCQTCFEKRHKSPLQYRQRLPQGTAAMGTHNKWACNLCKGEVTVYYGRKPHIPWEPKDGE